MSNLDHPNQFKNLNSNVINACAAKPTKKSVTATDDRIAGTREPVRHSDIVQQQQQRRNTYALYFAFVISSFNLAALKMFSVR